ncbi:MAG: DUF3426 domain-containing protein [Candidatus Binatia bacterium]
MNRSKALALALIALALPPVAVPAASAGDAAEVVEHDGTWELAYGLVYYRVFGKVKNVSKEPLRFVKLELELLDKDGKPVLARAGYNQKAEALGDQETEGYVETQSFEERLAKVQPIAPGETDLFRIGLAKDDIPKKPKFTTYRIRVVEVPK